MAGSSKASTDSTKTLSASAPAGPAALTSILKHAPHEFLQPSGNAIQDAALNLVKCYFDPLLKGGQGASGLDTVYLEGFDVEQVWEQVRSVVEDFAIADAPELGSSGEGSDESGSDDEDVTMMEEDESSDDEEAEEGEFEGFAEELEESGEEEGSEDGGVALEDEESGEESGEEEELEGEELEGEDDDEEENEEEEDDEVKDLVVDVHGLNDGFFSIDDFNRQTEMLEQLDANGGAIDSDDEDFIDLNNDPAHLDSDEEAEDDEEAHAKTKKSKLQDEGDEEEDDDDDDNMDLDVEGGDNANDIKYNDFFAPPARKRTGAPKKKASWRDEARKMYPEAEYEAVQSDMDRVRRDLFDDEDAPSDDEDVDMDGDPADPMNRRSSHQKRQAALTDEIRKLETENVAKKQWVMTGEAKARDRPLNSLLEQDLDFERSGKPVPVITQEVTEGLEDMIKRRILDAEFDEVIKRRPGDVTEKFRRGRVELDDSKPQESLAEVYAKEHLKSTNPDENPEAADEKLDKEHRDIEAIWGDVSRKLDALTSWHYTPKPANSSVAIRRRRANSATTLIVKATKKG